MNSLFFFLLPFASVMGIVLGVILPPLFFGRDWVSVLVLNLCGYIFFLYPCTLYFSAGMWGDIPVEQQTRPEAFLEALLGATILFFLLEALLWLLRWLVLGIGWLVRRGKTPPTRPTAEPPTA